MKKSENMSLQFFAQKMEANKIAIVGILTSNIDINASQLTKFLCSGVKLGQNNATIKMVKADDEFITPYGEKDFSTYDASGLLTSQIWAGYQANNQNSFGGFVGLFQTLTFSEEIDTFRYVFISAIDDTANLLNGEECLFFKSTDASMHDGNLSFRLTMSDQNTQARIGNNLGDLLTMPLWSYSDKTYQLNSSLTLACASRLDRYTQILAEHGRCNDETLENWANNNGFSHRVSPEYIPFLQFHLANNSPMLAKIKENRLLSNDEWEQTNQLSTQYFVQDLDI